MQLVHPFFRTEPNHVLQKNISLLILFLVEVHILNIHMFEISEIYVVIALLSFFLTSKLPENSFVRDKNL